MKSSQVQPWSNGPYFGTVSDLHSLGGAFPPTGGSSRGSEPVGSTTSRARARKAPESLTAVRKVLFAFRAVKGWQPGQVWDPWAGAYVGRAQATHRPPVSPPSPAPGRHTHRPPAVNQPLTGQR